MDVVSGAGKPSESDPDSSTRIQTPKPVSFTNGVLKRGYGHGGSGNGGVVYKECLKNHAASLGAHALDGCGEFMPSPAANPADPTSLKCAACGCHRNFHRQENEDSLPGSNTTTGTPPSLDYHPHHRHHPPPPPTPGDGGGGASTPSSPSPPPISSSYYPSAPHLLLTLSGGSTPVVGGGNRATATPVVVVNGSSGGGRKRFRTRFTQNQKDKMLEFAEKLGWKMQKKDEELIVNFCNEIAVERGVFKVWMHNNKNIFGKKEDNSSSLIPATVAATGGTLNSNISALAATAATPTPAPSTIVGNGVSFLHQNLFQNNNVSNNNHHHFHGDGFDGRIVGPNGSSSTS